jgi:hypothetical protein
LKVKIILECVCIDGRIMLRWFLMKQAGRAWTGLIWLRRQVLGSCECSNKYSGSIKCGEFLD